VIQLGTIIVSSHAWQSCLSMEGAFVLEQGFGQTFLSGCAPRVLYSQTFSMRKESKKRRNWSDCVWNLVVDSRFHHSETATTVISDFGKFSE